MSEGRQGADWREALESAVSESLVSVAPVAGGDIGSSFRVELESGATCFLKLYADGPDDIACREAEGLAWLAAPRAIDVGRPIAVGGQWLALEWIEPGRPAPDYAARLGRGLAALHRAGAPRFGLDRDNWLATLPQPNGACDDWATFYGERRLRPLIRRALDAQEIDARLTRRLDGLIEALPERIGPQEAPARLHGDLWSGNVMSDARGRPVLIDPAVYGGHREIDLAMMRLFGGFPAEVFDAYTEVWPLAPGSDERVDLYQVYPLLVHVCLFGSHYADKLSRTLSRCGF